MRIHLSLLLPLLCPVVTLACTPDRYPGQFVGSYQAEFAADQPLLLAVENTNADLFLEAEAFQGRLNSPGGRNSRDYLLLETSELEDSAEICVYSTLLHSANPDFQVSEYPLNNLEQEDLDSMRRVNEAGRRWEAGGFEDIEVVVQAYADLADMAGTILPDNPGFAFDMIYYAALANMKQRRYAETERYLQLLEAEPYVSLPGAYRAILQEGKVKVRQGQFEAAALVLENVRSRLLAAVNLRPELAWDLADADTMLGEVYATLMQLQLAQDRLDEARQYAQPDFQLLGHVNNNEGYLSVKRSEVDGLGAAEKISFLEQAVQKTLTASYFYTQAKDTFSRQIAENNSAVDYVRLGERRKSLLHFSNLIALLEEYPNPEGRAFYFSNISNYTAILGDYIKARAYLEESIRLSEGSDSRQIPGYHCRLGTLQRLLGNMEEAIDAHHTCLEMGQQNGWLEHVAEAKVQLSIDYAQLEDQAQATSAIEDALALVGEIDDPNIIKRLYSQYGEVLLASGQYDAAEAAVEQSIDTAIDGRYFNDHIDALYLAQRIQDAQGDRQGAIALAEQTLLQIEDLYAELDPEKLSPAWGNQTNKVFRHLADMYMSEYHVSSDQRYLDLALATTERSLDPSLRQHLSVSLSHDIITMEARERMRLFSDISNNLASSADQPDLEGSNLVDYYHQHDLLSLARLNNIQRIEVPAPVAIATVQESLDDDQLVLYYMPEQDSFRLVTITRADVRVGKLVAPQVIRQMLGQVEQSINLVDENAEDLLTVLSARVLPDLSQYPQISELLVVGQAGLSMLPFSALNTATDEYIPLIDQYSLKQLPSLSSYFMAKPQDAQDSENSIAIFADPVFSTLQLSAVDRYSPAADELRGWSENLQPLPFSALEARNISNQFPGKAEVFTGTRASRKNLGGAVARNAKVLHLATHGYFNTVEEDKLGLALSSVDESGNPQPGFVTLTELFSYAFNNELVVISGCETALGQEQAGIGLNSLSRGFHVQGVKHVISTLWQVSDRASAAFMALFYTHLEQQDDVALALQLAQKDMSRNEDYSHPFYWAAYTLTTVDPDSALTL